MLNFESIMEKHDLSFLPSPDSALVTFVTVLVGLCRHLAFA